MPKDLWQKISDAFLKAIRFIHSRGGYTPRDLNSPQLRPLLDSTYRVLSQGVTRGLKDDDIPAAMRLYLMDNTFRFSGFKTHRQLQAASRLLMDNGRIRPFSDFLQKVRKIDKDYNATYLNAEYNFAVASAQMAAKWHDFEKSGDDFYLQYRTARDERVRSSHRPLDRITLPIDDPFWDEYTPPLGWNCRCQLVQVRKDNHTPSNSSEAIARGKAATFQPNSKGQNKAQIFRFNPGKQKVVFPPKHPYFPKGCGNCSLNRYAADKDRTDCSICEIIRKQSFKEGKKTLRKELARGIHEIPVIHTNGLLKINTDGLKDYTGHSYTTDDLCLLADIVAGNVELRYVDSAPVKLEDHTLKNYEMKKKRGMKSFSYYVVEYQGKSFWLSFANIKDQYETPYAVDLYNSKEKRKK